MRSATYRMVVMEDRDMTPADQGIAAARRDAAKIVHHGTEGWLSPGFIYSSIDDALHAASCLCNLHRDGATVYGTTEGPDIDPDTEEAYQVACASVRADGSTWPAPPAPYRPIYTITGHSR